jgi:IPT/TIG domain
LGQAGSRVLILGNNLTGTTAVTFNATPAAFTVFSDTLIEATVPTGGTSGFVRVVTPKEALKSNTEFKVVP